MNPPTLSSVALCEAMRPEQVRAAALGSAATADNHAGKLAQCLPYVSTVAGNFVQAAQKRMENSGCNTRLLFFTFLSLQLSF